MNLFYSDANPLLRWAEAQIPGASTYCQQIAKETERIIKAADANFVMSEITIIEFHNNLFTYERDPGKPKFCSPDVDQCLQQLMRWIKLGQIQVIQPTPKLVEKAMAYVQLATRKKACALRAWDAVHLVQANDLAHERKAIVSIITNDHIFLDFIKKFPEFTEFVRVYDPLKRKFYP